MTNDTARPSPPPARAGLYLAAAVLISACAGLPGGEPTPEPAEPEAPAIEIEPADRARFEEAESALRAGDPERAATAFGEVAKNYPELAAAHANEGLARMRAGDNRAAIAAMQRAVELRPDNPAWQTRLGVLLRRVGEFQRAEKAYKAALAADNTYANAHLNLGILYDIFLQRPREALSHYQQYQTLAGQPDDEVALWIADLERRL